MLQIGLIMSSFHLLLWGGCVSGKHSLGTLGLVSAQLFFSPCYFSVQVRVLSPDKCSPPVAHVRCKGCKQWMFRSVYPAGLSYFS
jgi:hypothetical protein